MSGAWCYAFEFCWQIPLTCYPFNLSEDNYNEKSPPSVVKTALGLAVIAALNSPPLYAAVLEVHYDATPAAPVLRILGNNFRLATSFVYVNNLKCLSTKIEA
ncbi:hypothetical protein [Methyloglobulus sp.]|uniref:hypothetical protein n=1 Tax=Methyloglobulus sp. TaxID=2518622 RepID=UPI0032B82D73